MWDVVDTWAPMTLAKQFISIDVHRLVLSILQYQNHDSENKIYKYITKLRKKRLIVLREDTRCELECVEYEERTEGRKEIIRIDEDPFLEFPGLIWMLQR